MSEIGESVIEKIFPDYFNRFTLPECARDEAITVYRACRTRKCERASFLPTFEQQGLEYKATDDPCDPGVYSLSTFEKPNHIKVWASCTNEYNEPYAIAIGTTNPKHGPCQRTKERKSHSKSHVDWWLYRDARPYEEFEIISDFNAYLEKYKEENE